MFAAPTPFPYVGSFALYDHEGQRRLARIVARNFAGTEALVSLPNRPDAGGNLTVPLADLIDGTPLDAAEEAELRQLEIDCHPFIRRKKRARTEKQKAAMRRLAELGERRIHARVLAEKIAEHQRRQQAREAA